MKRLAAALCLFWVSVQGAIAGSIANAGSISNAAAVDRAAVLRIDWQYPWQLPPPFRNRCAYEYFTARPFCSDHCGNDNQFYHCSEASFGCCHLGRGYCDWNGLLHCHP